MPTDSDQPEVLHETPAGAGAAPDATHDDDLLLLLAGFVLMPIFLRHPGRQSS